MKKALILTNKMHLNTYVRMILDVLSNLRMPERKCAIEMLGGPGSERGREGGRVEIGGKQGNNQKVFQLNRNISASERQEKFLFSCRRQV